MVSLFQGGSFFGAGAQYYMTERWGRKWSIIVSNIIFIASAFMQTFANGSVSVQLARDGILQLCPFADLLLLSRSLPAAGS
jgi:hypothetical protein